MSEATQAERLAWALAACHRQLNRRERTVEETRRYLERRGVDPETREEALRCLQNDGLLDDARYARMLAEDKRALADWGPTRIRRTLLERGIDRDLVDDALREELPGADRERALALLRRRFPVPPTEGSDRERALAVLLRKGYESELALEALAAHARGSA